MVRLIFLLTVLSTWAQSYPPGAGEEGTTAISYDSELFVSWVTGIELERGLINISDPNAQHNGSNYASYGVAEDALGMADNVVVSLGDAGTAILIFETPITDGDGFDFAVFENGFNNYFLELAFVEASSDGVNFFRFPAHSETQTDTQVDGFGELDPTYLNNLAGKYRTLFGTPFDISELPDDPLLDKTRITHVKLIDVVGSINPHYASYDSYENIINDPFPTPFNSGGFDLDAVGVINAYSLSAESTTAVKTVIYPNPAKNVFTVKSNLPIRKIKVFDLFANNILQVYEETVAIDHLTPGMYWVKVHFEDKISLFKLIKK